MIDMTTVIAKMFMLFAIMITGFITSRLGVIDETANKKFSTLVVNITAPALILASASDDKLSGSRTDALFVLLIACCMYLFLYIVSFSVKYIFRLKQKQIGLYRFMTIFGNNAFMGIPVVNAIFNNVFYAALFNLPNNLLIYSLGGYLLSSNGEKKSKLTLKNIMNPGVISSALALIMFLCRIKLPFVVKDTLQCVGDVTTPLSMLVIGSSLATQSVTKTLKNVRAYLFSFFKLLIIPACVWFLGHFIITDFIILGVTVIISAMPCAAVTIMLCNEYDNDASAAAQTVFISTVLSVITIPVLTYLITLTL